MSKGLEFADIEKVNLLLRLLEIATRGLVKPYDPTPVASKIDALKRKGIDVSGLESCCPTAADIRDSKDFKPYVDAALIEIAKILELEVNYNDRNNY